MLDALARRFGFLDPTHRGPGYLEGDYVRIFIARRNGQVSLGRAKVEWATMGHIKGFFGIGEPEGSRVFLIDMDDLVKKVEFTGKNKNELRFRALWDEDGCRAVIAGDEIPGILLDPDHGEDIAEYEPPPSAPRARAAPPRPPTHKAKKTPAAGEKPKKRRHTPLDRPELIPPDLRWKARYLRERIGGHTSFAVEIWPGCVILRKGSVGRLVPPRKKDKEFLEWADPLRSRMVPLEGKRFLFILTEDVATPSWFHAAKLLEPNVTKTNSQDAWGPLSDLIPPEEMGSAMPPDFRA